MSTQPSSSAELAWYAQILNLIVFTWQRLLCAGSNLRRRLFLRRLTAYPILRLEGDLLERTPDAPWYYAFLPMYTAPLSLEAIDAALQRIAGDPDVAGVLFQCTDCTPSLAQAQSLRSLLNRFRAADRRLCPASPPKRIVFHLEQVTAPLYVAAAGADLIALTPLTEWDVKGLAATPLFFKDALAQVGIAFDVVRVAPWKTAADMFAADGLSDAAREQYNWLFDSLYTALVAGIASGRGLTPATVRTLIDRAPLAASDAQAAGLIDAVAYADELPALLGIEDERRYPQLYSRMRKRLYRHARRPSPGTVGVISLTGAIMTGASREFPVPLPLIGEDTLGSSSAQQQIRAARRDDSLDAVVVHVDSPGGSALASDLIWRELSLLAAEKPVVVYMGDVAASGGYYIATPAHKIVAQAATLTGSIGVILAKPVAAEALDKAHIRWETLRRGEHADLYASVTPWTEDARAAVAASMDAVYRTFKERVVAGRGIDLAALDDLAGGRVWTGEQALAHGLVDALGDFHTAVELACRAAGLPADGSVRVEAVATGRWQPALPQAPEQAELARWQTLARFLTGGELARLLQRERLWLLADGLPKQKQ
jgi:protease-4